MDDRALVDLIEWQIESGSHGIGVTGTTGEPAALSIEEQEHVIELAVLTARKRVPVVAGTGSVNADETLRLTRFAKKAGAAAALVVVPYYTRPSQEGLYQFFRTVASAVDMPIILYNIPGRTAVNLEVETTARLARDCRNIIGIKESNKDLEHICRVMHRCGRQFLVYSGIELLCFPILALGGAGHASATGNVMPREVARLYDLVAAGQWDEARDLHYYLLPMNDALFMETNPVPAKAAPGKIMGFALTYRDHAAELGIGAPPDPAPEVVRGYTIANDVTVRDFVGNFYRPPVKAKGWDTFCPLGPVLVEGEIGDPHRLGLRAFVNDELRQEGTTADLAYTVSDLIAFLSEFMTLEPDDVILTGTPRGISHVYPGDRMRIEIDSLGALENPVVVEGGSP